MSRARLFSCRPLLRANLTVAGRVSGVASPVAPNDAANKQYVDGAVSGLRWKDPVDAATTANLASLSGLLTVDDVALAAGSRVLVRAQTNGVQNGVYAVSSGGWLRAADLAAGSSAGSAAFYVGAGTAYGGKSFVCSNAAGADVVGTDALAFVVFTSSSGGDVVGPASAADNAVARFDAVSGKIIQSSGVSISDAADVAGVKTLELSGSASGAVTIRPAAATVGHTLTLPANRGAPGAFLLVSSVAGDLAWTPAGDVTGASSSVDNAVARFDATSGKAIQGSSVTISDTADIAGARTLALSTASAGVLTLAPAANTATHTLTFPADRGATGAYLRGLDGTGALTWGAAGDVSSAAPSTDNAVARFDSTTGKVIQNSAVTISDGADIAGAKTLGLSGATSGVLSLAPASTTPSHTLTFPADKGAQGTFLQSFDNSGTIAWAAAGNVTSAGASTDNAAQNSGVTISDAAEIAGARTLALSGATSGADARARGDDRPAHAHLPGRQGRAGYLPAELRQLGHARLGHPGQRDGRAEQHGQRGRALRRDDRPAAAEQHGHHQRQRGRRGRQDAGAQRRRVGRADARAGRHDVGRLRSPSAMALSLPTIHAM
jgi:hypothetical protein